jgi:DNA-binding transcriptional MerR regulator
MPSPLPANSTPSLTASEAASRLGVSAKALRLYEQQGLLTPGRTAAGYRVYGADDMRRATEVVALRALGLSLAQVACVMAGDTHTLSSALAAHESMLDEELQGVLRKLDRVRAMRADLARGQLPAADALAQLLARPRELGVSFALPWPWGGEHFALHDIRPLNYLIGSLGSGKTRLARRLAEVLSDASFLGLDRVIEVDHADPALAQRVAQTLAWLVEDGAVASEALRSLLFALEAEAPAVLVVDMVEQGLPQATQEALIRHLRHTAKTRRRCLFLMTRSSSILDLAAVGPDEAIILCPPNHSPPMRVAPYPGSPGYEAVATCLASPAVRARIARQPEDA